MPDRTYAGELVTLPDRGPNGVGSVAGTVDYPNRLHAHRLILAGGKLTITPTGGFLLKDQNGSAVHRQGPQRQRADPRRRALSLAGDRRRRGQDQPGSRGRGLSAGRRLLRFRRVRGRRLSVRQNGAADRRDPGAAGPARRCARASWTSPPRARPTTGRRTNQGLEALAVTPDGKRLVAILQERHGAGHGRPRTPRHAQQHPRPGLRHHQEPHAQGADRPLRSPTAHGPRERRRPGRRRHRGPVRDAGPERPPVPGAGPRRQRPRARARPRHRCSSPCCWSTPPARTNLAGTPYEQGVEPIADGRRPGGGPDPGQAGRAGEPAGTPLNWAGSA